ncbi:MAG: preQ(1) synthase [Candidatus Sumerlaeota bacterium]|nr:preQ(1) synthase [Candidatus Sumerlaeota bacterium]
MTANNKKSNAPSLKWLGRRVTKYPATYTPNALEVVENEFQDNDYVVELDCPEFTSLCPITGQPDFGRIVIRYSPGRWLVESKSLKIYLHSFRNYGSFHEHCVNLIARDLFKRMKPKWIEVTGHFNPRGGISIRPTVRLER